MLRTAEAGSPARICAWCNDVLQAGTAPVTHGICESCESAWSMSARKMQRGGLGDDRFALHVTRADEGWELRSRDERGIIFPTYAAAMDLARTWMEDGHHVVVPLPGSPELRF